MNTHAVLMSAYNDFDILLNNVKILAPCFDCYIHVDRKAEFPPEIRRKLQEYPNVYVIQKYRITWGSYKHILAFLELLKMAEPKGYALVILMWRIGRNYSIHLFFVWLLCPSFHYIQR